MDFNIREETDGNNRIEKILKEIMAESFHN